MRTVEVQSRCVSYPTITPLPLQLVTMSNPFQEPAFEASIYHYFLFKANQAATALHRERTEKRNNNNDSTPLKVLATTAASNEKKSPIPTNDVQHDADGDAKMSSARTPYDEQGNDETSSDSSRKNAPKLTSKSPASVATDKSSNKPTPPAPAGVQILPRLPAMGTLPGPYPQAAGAFPGMPPHPSVQPPIQYPYPSNFSLGLLGPRLAAFPGAPPMAPVPGANVPPMNMVPVNPATGSTGVSGKATGQSPSNRSPTPAAAAEKTNDSPKTPTAEDTSESIASVMHEKYSRLASVMNEEFPQYVNMIPPNAPFLAPDVSMRYAHFPPVHTEVGFLRQRVQMLQQQLQQQQAQNHQMQEAIAVNPIIRKRGRPANDATVPYDASAPLAKKLMTEAVRKRIHNRPDVPDDVKEHVAQLKKEASENKSKLRKKIGRLEKKLSKTQEKLNAVNAANKSPAAKLPPLPLQQENPAADALPESSPAEPPATFDSRFQELLDYQRANNTCRVPGRIPGLGRCK